MSERTQAIIDALTEMGPSKCIDIARRLHIQTVNTDNALRRLEHAGQVRADRSGPRPIWSLAQDDTRQALIQASSVWQFAERMR